MSMNIKDLETYPEVAVRIALLYFISGNISETQRINEIIIKWYEHGDLAIPSEEYIDLFWEIGWLSYINPNEDIFFNSKFDEWVNIKEYAPHLMDNDRSRASALRFPSILRGPRDFSTDVERFIQYYDVNLKKGFVRDEIILLIFDLIIAEISYEREDFGKTEKIVREIMPKVEKLKLTDLYFSCTCLLVKVLRALHKSEEIDELTTRAKTLIMNNGHLFLLPNFHAFELCNRLANGIPGVTEIFERENKYYTDKTYYFLIYRHMTYIRALLSEGKYNKANLILGNLELLCRQYKRNMDLIEINILRSIAEYSLEYREDACRYLKIAIDEARKCGFIRVFSDDAVSIWPILSLVRKSGEDTFIKKITISCKKMLARTKVASHVDKTEYEPLTKKEIEILNLLNAGMSYEEIALDNNIKVGTVRTHIHSIYSKLNVSNKISALIWARKNGIIENSTLFFD